MKKQSEITTKDVDKVIDKEEIKPMSVPVKEFVTQPVERHKWIQKGAFLECVSCDTPHGTHIGTEQILTGIDSSGNPILENVKLTVSKPQRRTKKK